MKTSDTRLHESFNFDVDSTLKLLDILGLSTCTHFTNSHRPQKIDCSKSTQNLLNFVFAQHKYFEKRSPLKLFGYI